MSEATHNGWQLLSGVIRNAEIEDETNIQLQHEVGAIS